MRGGGGMKIKSQEKAVEISKVDSEEVTKQHGGARAGAGRKKKYGVETCTIRIPKSAKEEVLQFLDSKDWE